MNMLKISKERYQEAKWRYKNHFKDEDHSERLLEEAECYIEDLEQRNRDLETEVELLSEEVKGEF